MYVLGKLYQDASRFDARRQHKAVKKSKAKNVRGHKTMGHASRPRNVTNTIPVRNRVQKKKKHRSAMSYIKYGLLGQQIRQSKKIKAVDDTIKYGNYTYAILDFLL